MQFTPILPILSAVCGLKVACENSSRDWDGDYIGNRGTVAIIEQISCSGVNGSSSSYDGAAHSSVGRGSIRGRRDRRGRGRGRRDREDETQRMAVGQVYVKLKESDWKWADQPSPRGGVPCEWQWQPQL